MSVFDVGGSKTVAILRTRQISGCHGVCCFRFVKFFCCGFAKDKLFCCYTAGRGTFSQQGVVYLEICMADRIKCSRALYGARCIGHTPLSEPDPVDFVQEAWYHLTTANNKAHSEQWKKKNKIIQLAWRT